MPENTIAKLPDPSGFSTDPFTDIIRDGARKLIEQAIQAELAVLMAAFSAEKLENGTSRLVRHGYLPEREVMTGIGPVPGLCCANPVRDSSRESSMVAGVHEQTHIPDLQDQELASL